jgi:carbamoyl-phosphate synthase large subunit
VLPVPGIGIEVLPVPPASDPQFLGVVRRIVRDRSVAIVLPTVSEELLSFSLAAPGFPPDVLVVVASPGAVAVANDKLSTAWSLAQAGVPVPEFCQPADLAGLDEALAVLGSPFIAKPRVSRGARGVTLVRSSRDLDWAALDDSWILQQFAPGPEFAPVCFGAIGEAAAKSLVILEKTGLSHGLTGNATEVRRLPPNEAADVADLSRATVAALGLSGPVDIDIRRLNNGMPVVLEVNARFGANSRSAPELLDEVLAHHRARLALRAA